MKILHLSSEKTWRGGEQQIAYVIDELTKLGISNVAAVRRNSVFEEHCRKKGIPFFSLPFSGSIDFRSAFAIKKICREQNIDLVHMHNSRSHSTGVLSVWVGNKTPLVLSRRVDFVPKQSGFTKWKYNHPAIKKVLCVSGKITEIMQHYLRHPERALTVHSGVDLHKFDGFVNQNKLRTQYHVDGSKVLIGNTSALEDHKDYYTFLNTIELLHKNAAPIHAFIIGTGSLEQPLKLYAQQKGIDTIVTFTGFRNDIKEVLPELDIFFMPSKEEGLGTSILDALAAHIPVVATRAGGIPEMIVHEQTGLLAEPGDAATLSQHIARLIRDNTLRDKLIAGANIKIHEFSKEQTALKTLRVYEDVLGIKAGVYTTHADQRQ